MKHGRIIFVGVHNKPRMEPLDSRTKSGKIIDDVIAGLPGRECVKTNLFNLDRLPHRKADYPAYATVWRAKIRPCDYDVVVPLGQIVQDHFPSKRIDGALVIKAEHPASRRIKKDEYIKDLIDKILKA
jgi:hypothetical protein